MGNNIKESSVPFDIDRKLTQKELDETVKYCTHDVEHRLKYSSDKDDFEAHILIVKLACQGNLPLNLSPTKTKPQLSAIILDASKEGSMMNLNLIDSWEQP